MVSDKLVVETNSPLIFTAGRAREELTGHEAMSQLGFQRVRQRREEFIKPFIRVLF